MDWMMYTPAGNAAVSSLMERVREALNDRPLPKVRELLERGMKDIATQHGEIYDTDVRWAIHDEVTRWAEQAHKVELDRDYWGLI